MPRYSQFLNAVLALEALAGGDLLLASQEVVSVALALSGLLALLTESRRRL